MPRSWSLYERLADPRRVDDRRRQSSAADGGVVFAGVGAPLEASALAKRLHAPSLTIVLEEALSIPVWPPASFQSRRTRCGRRTTRCSCSPRSLTCFFTGSVVCTVPYGFIGAAQVDQFGNVNTSYIGDPDDPKVRLPGSGGADDISLAAVRSWS